MMSLQDQEVHESTSNAAFFSSPSPFKLSAETQSSSGICFQLSLNDNQVSHCLSDEKVQSTFTDSPEQQHLHLQQQDSTDESNNNQENLSIASQHAETNFKSSQHSYRDIKTQSNQGNDIQTVDNIQLVDVEDDSTSNQEPLRLPQIFDEDGDDELITFNQYKSNGDQEIEQYSDLKESNSLYSLVSIQGNRKEMQDKYSTFADFGNLNYYAVFDGHGNDKIASYLKENLFSQITSHPSFFTNTEEAITQAFVSLDEQFQTKDEFQGSGCVCVCALIMNGNLYIGNLGDCRAVIFDKNGKSRDLSFDHTPSSRKDEVERILNQNGFCLRSGSQLRVSGELNVTRAFGDKRYKPFIIAQPEIIVYDIYSLLSEFEFKGIFLVLASDGLWNDYNQKSSSLLCNEGYQFFPEKALDHIFEQKQCFRDNTTILSINIQQYYLSLFSSYCPNQIAEPISTD